MAFQFQSVGRSTSVYAIMPRLQKPGHRDACQLVQLPDISTVITPLVRLQRKCKRTGFTLDRLRSRQLRITTSDQDRHIWVTHLRDCLRSTTLTATRHRVGEVQWQFPSSDVPLNIPPWFEWHSDFWVTFLWIVNSTGWFIRSLKFWAALCCVIVGSACWCTKSSAKQNYAF